MVVTLATVVLLATVSEEERGEDKRSQLAEGFAALVQPPHASVV